MRDSLEQQQKQQRDAVDFDGACEDASYFSEDSNRTVTLWILGKAVPVKVALAGSCCLVLVMFTLISFSADEVGPCEENGEISCGPHSSCSNTNDGCTCDAGYTGPNCEIGPCEGETCSNKGTPSVVGIGCECSCDAGYTGSHCENDPCHDIVCTDTHKTAKIVVGSTCACACERGYNGTNCEFGPCHGETCSGHGTASVVGSHCNCYCDAGFQGYHCEFDACHQHYCRHPQTPTIVREHCECRCPEGYTGSTCEYDLCGHSRRADACPFSRSHRFHIGEPSIECGDHGSCVVVRGSVGTSDDESTAHVDMFPQCFCDLGYEGARCEIGPTCEHNLCSGHGNCDAGSEQTPRCVCDPGFIDAMVVVANSTVLVDIEWDELEQLLSSCRHSSEHLWHFYDGVWQGPGNFEILPQGETLTVFDRQEDERGNQWVRSERGWTMPVLANGATQLRIVQCGTDLSQVNCGHGVVTSTCPEEDGCDPGNYVALCACQAPYSGVQCEHDPCMDEDCSGHGTCAIVGSEAVCTCDAGYFSFGESACSTSHFESMGIYMLGGATACADAPTWSTLLEPRFLYLDGGPGGLRCTDVGDRLKCDSYQSHEIEGERHTPNLQYENDQVAHYCPISCGTIPPSFLARCCPQRGLCGYTNVISPGVCQGNFDGPFCDTCKPGYSGEACDIPQCPPNRAFGPQDAPGSIGFEWNQGHSLDRRWHFSPQRWCTTPVGGACQPGPWRCYEVDTRNSPMEDTGAPGNSCERSTSRWEANGFVCVGHRCAGSELNITAHAYQSMFSANVWGEHLPCTREARAGTVPNPNSGRCVASTDAPHDLPPCPGGCHPGTDSLYRLRRFVPTFGAPSHPSPSNDGFCSPMPGFCAAPYHNRRSGETRDYDGDGHITRWTYDYHTWGHSDVENMFGESNDFPYRIKDRIFTDLPTYSGISRDECQSRCDADQNCIGYEYNPTYRNVDHAKCSLIGQSSSLGPALINGHIASPQNVPPSTGNRGPIVYGLQYVPRDELDEVDQPSDEGTFCVAKMRIGESPDPCRSLGCDENGSHGYCVIDEDGSARCECMEGWSGTGCDVSPCDGVTCECGYCMEARPPIDTRWTVSQDTQTKPIGTCRCDAAHGDAPHVGCPEAQGGEANCRFTECPFDISTEAMQYWSLLGYSRRDQILPIAQGERCEVLLRYKQPQSGWCQGENGAALNYRYVDGIGPGLTPPDGGIRQCRQFCDDEPNCIGFAFRGYGQPVQPNGWDPPHSTISSCGNMPGDDCVCHFRPDSTVSARNSEWQDLCATPAVCGSAGDFPESGWSGGCTGTCRIYGPGIDPDHNWHAPLNDGPMQFSTVGIAKTNYGDGCLTRSADGTSSLDPHCTSPTAGPLRSGSPGRYGEHYERFFSDGWSHFVSDACKYGHDESLCDGRGVPDELWSSTLHHPEFRHDGGAVCVPRNLALCATGGSSSVCECGDGMVLVEEAGGWRCRAESPQSAEDILVHAGQCLASGTLGMFNSIAEAVSDISDLANGDASGICRQLLSRIEGKTTDQVAACNPQGLCTELLEAGPEAPLVCDLVFLGICILNDGTSLDPCGWLLEQVTGGDESTCDQIESTLVDLSL